jgi:type III pantothenate kinase
LYYGHLGALQEISSQVVSEVFEGRKPRIIATGGFASLFEKTGLFDHIVPDLVLRGLLSALLMNLDEVPG